MERDPTLEASQFEFGYGIVRRLALRGNPVPDVCSTREDSFDSSDASWNIRSGGEVKVEDDIVERRGHADEFHIPRHNTFRAVQSEADQSWEDDGN